MNLQTNFTSNLYKLIFNAERIEEIKKGIFRPLSMHFSLTDECNLNCKFCSNKKRKGNTFELKEVINILNTFKMLGTKSVEFTGGEPTLHKNINEIISYTKNSGYSIGLKSNGIHLKKHLTIDSLKNLTWLRISMNCLDYINADSLDFEDISYYTTFGFSYVIHDDTNFKIFDKIKQLKDKYKVRYVRIIPDNSYSEEKIVFLKNTLNEDIKKYGFFWHDKNYSIPEKCYMMWLKPFINTDRGIYYCCAVQMFERKFDKRFKLCSTDSDDIIKTWMKPKVYPGSMCKDGICYFSEHNDLIEALVEGCEHSDFI